MFDFLWHKQERKGLCSIEIYPDGIAFVYLPDFKQSQIEIKAVKFYPCDVKTEVAKTLHQIVEEHGVEDVKCNWVLHPNYYRLLLVDAPKVPDSEYQAAIKWQIKDMIDFSIDDVAVDYFQPLDTVRYYQNKLFVAVAKQSFIKTVVQFITNSRLKPIAVDIRELALRNLAALLSVKKQTVGFLDLYEDGALILIFQDDNIAFARQINYGFAELRKGEAPSLLLLELKRSMEYCVSELKQSIPTKILLPPIAEENKKLVENLTSSLGMDSQIIDLNNLVATHEVIKLGEQIRCYAALGGVLRVRHRNK